MKEYWIPSIPESALFGSKLADEWIQVKIGGDLALMMAILKRLVEWDAVNHCFIEQHTKGFAELSSAVDGLAMEELSEHSGVSIPRLIGLQQPLHEQTVWLRCIQWVLHSIPLVPRMFGAW